MDVAKPQSIYQIVSSIRDELQNQTITPPSGIGHSPEQRWLSSEQLRDTLTNFKMWAGNLGALHPPTDPRSLDARLQDAHEVSRRLTEVLYELHDLLKEVQLPCGCHSSPDSDSNQQVSPSANEDLLVLQLLGFKTSPSCKSTWIFGSVSNAIRRLFTISTLISRLTTRDRFARAEEKCRMKYYEDFDIEHVSEKLKQTSCHANIGWLSEKLGRANTKRRQYTAYCEGHRAELSGDTSDRDDRVDPSESAGVSLGMTKASTIGPPGMVGVDNGFDDARSLTTVATSIATSQDWSCLKVPDLSLYAEHGEHFKCPLCQTMQRFSGQSGWRRHVFADLRAYVCTFKECGILMFDSFKTWRNHELEQHRRQWICQLCRTTCQDRTKTLTHIRSRHKNDLNEGQMEIILEASSHYPETLRAKDCPFCDFPQALRRQGHDNPSHEVRVNSRRFMKHVGKHLEQLALFVMPQPEMGSDDGLGSDAVRISDFDGMETLSAISAFDSETSNRDTGGDDVADLPSDHENIDFRQDAQQGQSSPTSETGTLVKQDPPHIAEVPGSRTKNDDSGSFAKEVNDAGAEISSVTSYPNQASVSIVTGHVSIESRRPTNADWQRWKPTIDARYRTAPARVLIEQMKADCLHVTEKMFRDRLRQWGIRKGVSNRQQTAMGSVSISGEVSTRVASSTTEHGGTSLANEWVDRRSGKITSVVGVGGNRDSHAPGDGPSGRASKNDSSYPKAIGYSNDMSTNRLDYLNLIEHQPNDDLSKDESQDWNGGGRVEDTLSEGSDCSVDPGLPVLYSQASMVDGVLPIVPRLPTASSSGNSYGGYPSSGIEGYSTNHTTPIDIMEHTPRPMLPPPLGMYHVPVPPPPIMIPGPYKCDVPNCTAGTFQTRYLLNSHINVHSQIRPHYCPVANCSRAEGGKGFKRRNEMIRHSLVHNSPGYVCPFCPEREHKYPRPDNLQRHVRVHHPDKDPDDDILKDVLNQGVRNQESKARRRTTTNAELEVSIA